MDNNINRLVAAAVATTGSSKDHDVVPGQQSFLTAAAAGWRADGLLLSIDDKGRFMATRKPKTDMDRS